MARRTKRAPQSQEPSLFSNGNGHDFVEQIADKYTPVPNEIFTRDGCSITFAPVESLYDRWPSPVCIICDGPYGINGFPGDEVKAQTLAEWYRPHVEAWSRRSTGLTTLWFWCTEVGWANVHPVLEACGWEYRCCNIWDKGMGHVAGNANTQTLRKYPVVTEVCAHYVRHVSFRVGDRELTMQEWLRQEWLRTGIPLYKTNEACGVINAATRKYFTECHLWYYPPLEMFEKFRDYANKHGKLAGSPIVFPKYVLPRMAVLNCSSPGCSMRSILAKFVSSRFLN
jgi:hypothetical protein